MFARGDSAGAPQTPAQAFVRAGTSIRDCAVGEAKCIDQRLLSEKPCRFLEPRTSGSATLSVAAASSSSIAQFRCSGSRHPLPGRSADPVHSFSVTFSAKHQSQRCAQRRSAATISHRDGRADSGVFARGVEGVSNNTFFRLRSVTARR